MNLLHNRPLCQVLFVWLCGLVVFSRLVHFHALIVLGVLLVLFSVFVLKNLKNRGRALFSLLLLLTLLLSFVFSTLYYRMYLFSDNLYTGEHHIVAEVESVERKTTFTKTILHTTELDGKEASYRFLYYPDEEVHLSPGTVIECRVTIQEFTDGSDGFSARSYYAGKGFSGVISELTGLTETGTFRSVRRFFLGLQTYAAGVLSSVFPGDSGGLLCALLLGDRTAVDGKLSLDFSRTGISHILALSGLHLAILAAFVEKVFSLLRMKKTLRVILTSVLVLFYMFLTGLSPSVVRAGIMLLLGNLLYLCGRGRDGVTSLFVAVFLITAVSPYSVFDLSLWLSALATLGLLVAAESKNGLTAKKGALPAVYRAVRLGLYALFAVLLITVLSFSKISLLAPLVSPVFSLLAEIYMIVGMVLLPLGALFPVSFVMDFLYTLISSGCAAVSALSFSCVSARHPAVIILSLLFTLLAVGYVLLPVRRKKTYAALLLSVFTLTLAVATAFTYIRKAETDILYAPTGKNDCFYITDGGTSFCLDLSAYRNTDSRSVCSLLSREECVLLDVYCVTHYTAFLPQHIRLLAESVAVKEVRLPAPKTADESEIAEEVAAVAKEFAAGISFYEIGDSMEIGGITVQNFYRSLYGEGAATVGVQLLCSEKRILYLSSGILEGEGKRKASELSSRADTLILGCYGRKYSDTFRMNQIYDNLSAILVGGESVIDNDTYEDYTENTGVEFIADFGSGISLIR